MNGLVTLDQVVARALVECARAGAGGIVTASRGKLKRIFCIEQGALVYAASNLIEEQLDTRIAATGTVSAEALVRARMAGQGVGTKLSRALLDAGALGEAELRTALEQHCRELLFSTLDWSNGEATLTRGIPDLAGEVKVHLDCAALLREYARERPRSLDETRMRIGSPSSRPVRAEAAEQLLAGHDPGPAGKFLLEASDGSHPIAGLLDLSPQPLETTLRALYGLLLSGVLVPDTKARPTEARGTVTREEVLARLERTEGADYYTVLELGPAANASEIRDTYYFLARRYHPDRFRSGPLQDLRVRIESFFSQVTEAYNNLSDPALRAEYDAAREAAPTTKATPEQDHRYLARQNFAHAKLLMERGRNTDAVTSLENAIQLDASQAVYHLELGRLLSANPRMRARAEECLLRATQIDPAMAEAYVALGQLSTKQGRREDAIRHFREALRWEPGHIEAQSELQKLERETGDSGKRRGLFGRLSAAVPTLVDGDNVLGWWPGRRRSDAERRALAFELDRFAARERRRILVVFDGSAPPGLALGPAVRFAGAGCKADDVILALLRSEQDRAGWTVVTNDRPLGDQCRHLGARIERSDLFARRLKSVRAADKPEREEDMGYWLERFGEDS